MAADDDVFHLQDVNRVLYDRQAIEIGVVNYVRDVLVDKHLTGHHADKLVRWHTTVGASDP